MERSLALRVKTFANLGAYLSTFGTCVPTYLHGTLLQGLYTTPKINVDVTAVFTNTTAVDAYRGAGRPEATYLLERLIDLAAHEMNVDPAELRFKNFIPPFDGVNQPGYQTQVALQYDSGNYEGVLKKGLEMLGYENLRKEQKEAATMANCWALVSQHISKHVVLRLLPLLVRWVPEPVCLK